MHSAVSSSRRKLEPCLVLSLPLLFFFPLPKSFLLLIFPPNSFTLQKLRMGRQWEEERGGLFFKRRFRSREPLATPRLRAGFCREPCRLLPRGRQEGPAMIGYPSLSKDGSARRKKTTTGMPNPPVFCLCPQSLL